ncbi:hypothetical protein [Streptomyces sp. NBC_00454]|uniref:hypothetical protein n=1 Tax=Streptomyces sp. NBC_00454 TaxID=2975747 RepID=UPI00324D0DC8
MTAIPEWGPVERAFLDEGITRILARRFGPTPDLGKAAGERPDDELATAIIQALPGLLMAAAASLDHSAEAVRHGTAQRAGGAGSTAVHREP